jgi:hypothetical protein
LASLISGLLGGATAIESLASEARNRTWDWQRLSGLGAWSITWAKLLGSTLHAHYAAGLAYAVYVATVFAHEAQPRPNPLVIVLLGFALGALVQSAGMLIATWQLVSQRAQSSQAASYVLGAGASGLMLLVLLGQSEPSLHHTDSHTVHWYGWLTSTTTFALASVLTFLAWSVFGNYRLLRHELEDRSAPLAALGFPIFLACYLAGVVTPPFGAGIHGIVTARLLTAEGAIAGFAYLMCVAATMRRVDFARWTLGLRTNPRLAWDRTPAWIASTVMSLVTAVAIAVWIGATTEDSGNAAAISVVLALIVLRDAGLLVALRVRGGALASDGWLVVFVGCLHGFLPWIADGIGAKELRQFLSVDPTQGWHAVPVLICEILLVVQWVRKSWMRRPREPLRQASRAAHVDEPANSVRS